MPRKANERQGFHVFSLNDDSVPPPPQQTEPCIATLIDLETDIKTYNAAQHHLTLEISTLINSSQTSRRAVRLKKEGKQKAPRPQNAWILYRKDTNARFQQTKEYEGKKSSEISKIISKMWKNEREEVKNKFYVLAKWAGQLHETENINYKYSPKKSIEKSSKDNNDYELGNPFPSNLSNLSTPSSPYSEHNQTADFQNNIENSVSPPFDTTPQTTYFPDFFPYALVQSDEVVYIPEYDIYLPVLYLYSPLQF
ncbi:hypothetical protein RclHR1_00570016 [Rhizophagus clarus]|uniref:High mobility group box domain-containing protein n=1 Tax=Rhizophagus clarus TaxID=94130 RepID=A0A2Z6S5P0_9GLOM|nr:hypothetical protein RclHR1_00570016 [Rhizophagus clarus]GET04218.1 high mobility group box domain-containing protein [Rhizophagus clarus]